jgi:hypothetical protein
MNSYCNIRTEPDYSGLTQVDISPETPVAGYAAAVQLANAEAEKLYGDDYMLVAYRDGDRGFEFPQHVDECHSQSAVPGYIDYAIYHGASLKVSIEEGRFVLFYVATGECL